MGKAAQTRQFIIEKSAPIFNKLGYAGTSMQDLTAATGLTKGSIYGNFENKDEVALEAFKFNTGKMSEFLASEIAKAETFRDRLLVYPNLYEQFFTSSFPEGGCPVLNTSVESDDTHPALKAIAKKTFNNWRNGIAELVESGKKSGEFTSGIDAQAAAVTVLALVEGMSMIAKLTEDETQLKMLTAHLRKFINEF